MNRQERRKADREASKKKENELQQQSSPKYKKETFSSRHGLNLGTWLALGIAFFGGFPGCFSIIDYFFKKPKFNLTSVLQ